MLLPRACECTYTLRLFCSSMAICTFFSCRVLNVLRGCLFYASVVLVVAQTVAKWLLVVMVLLLLVCYRVWTVVDMGLVSVGTVSACSWVLARWLFASVGWPGFLSGRTTSGSSWCSPCISVSASLLPSGIAPAGSCSVFCTFLPLFWAACSHAVSISAPCAGWTWFLAWSWGCDWWPPLLVASSD
jgi:hypothetical protein